MELMKGKKSAGRKGVRFLAAAALSAALLGGQVYPAAAQDEQLEWEAFSGIPENITVDQPVSLGEIGLPEIEYGILEWADPSYVPSQRSESCEVILTPGDGVDLSQMEGWDEEAGVWRGSVTVVVASLEEPGEEDSGMADIENLSQNESSDIEKDGENDAVKPATGKQGTLENSGEAGKPDALEDSGEAGKQDALENSGDAGKPDDQESPGEEGEQQQASGGEEQSSGENADGTEDSSGGQAAGREELSADNGAADNGAADNGTADNGAAESGKEDPETSGSDIGGGEQDGESPEEDDSSQNGGENGDSQTEAPDSDEAPETGEDPNGGSADEMKPEEPENIFDRTEITADNRPLTAEDDLTEEEKLARAAENHTCDGIYVSGINLPWYVQFRVYSGETYEFSNEQTANIFKSYKFELWDLKNECEYEIPDGEYVSVTVPVKEGYEYTVEHILDNGAIETIIPSVEGNIMIFSTHSFSSFGIAGSKPVVGDDVTDQNYPNTPTPSPTKKPGNTPTPTPSGGSGNNTVDKDHPGYTGSENNTVDKDNAGYVDNGGNTSDQDNGNSGKVDKDNAGYVNGENSSSSRAVATGDSTMIYPFLILLGADIVMLLAVIAAKIRRAR